MIVQLIKRARFLVQNGETVFASPALMLFMQNTVILEDFEKNESYLNAFANLDDYDIWGAIKIWVNNQDKILSTLARMLLDRKLFKVMLSDEKVETEILQNIKIKVKNQYQLKENELDYFFVKGSTKNTAYETKNDQILILTQKRGILDITEASDLPTIKALTKIVKKYYVCWAR